MNYIYFRYYRKYLKNHAEDVFIASVSSVVTVTYCRQCLQDEVDWEYVDRPEVLRIYEIVNCDPISLLVQG